MPIQPAQQKRKFLSTTFQKPPPSRVIEQVALMAAEEPAEYF